MCAHQDVGPHEVRVGGRVGERGLNKSENE